MPFLGDMLVPWRVGAIQQQLKDPKLLTILRKYRETLIDAEDACGRHFGEKKRSMGDLFFGGRGGGRGG